MRRIEERGGRLWWFTALALALALVAVGLGVWRGVARRFPTPVAEAEAASLRGDWPRTALLAQKWLKQAPADPVALRLAARAAAHQDRHEATVGIYSRLVVGDMDPEDFFLLGRALQRTGQVDAAFKAYETARSYLPDHPETLDALARLYLQNDRYYAAEEAAQRLARQPAWEAHAQLMLGTARAELDDPAGAAQALKRWLELDPQGKAADPHPVVPFRVLLVRSLLKSRQPAAARAILQRLLLKSGSPEASWLLSRTFIQERDWEHAAAALKQAGSFGALHPLEFEPAPYVGAARCAGCHAEIYRSATATRHAATFARARDTASITLPEKPFPDPGNPEVMHQYKRVADSLSVETGVSGRALRAVVDYAFGSLHRYTTFVGRDDQAHPVMLRMSYYESPRGSGWDVSTGLAPKPPDENEYLGKKMVDRDGVRRCLYCHTTSFRAVLDQSGPEAADRSIGCERCHGPGGHHVAAAEAGFQDLAIANGRAASGAEVTEMCGKCHSMQRPEVITAPKTDPVWYRFQALTLTWSRCYTQSDGKLGCVTCHDPHRDVERSVARNEAKCLACHATTSAPAVPRQQSASISPRAAERSREEPTTGARRNCPINPRQGCIDCHMPRDWQESTHSFKTDHFIRVRGGA